MKRKHMLLALGFWLFCGVAAGALVWQAQPEPDKRPDKHPAAVSAAKLPAISDKKAAKETQVPGLKVLAAGDAPSRLAQLGIFIGYVEEDTSPGSGKYTCGAMTRGKSIDAAQTIDRALSDIPDEALGKTRLKYIMVCSFARASGNQIGGIPVPPLKLLMLDMEEAPSSTYEARRLVLHELYHYIEFRLDNIKDKKWNRSFGEGYANSYSLRGTDIGAGSKGFLNPYAQTFPHEERAEIFAQLLTDPRDIASYIEEAQDKILYDKVLYMLDKSERLLDLRIDFAEPDL